MTWLKLRFVGCQLGEAFGIPEVVNTGYTTFEYLRKEECWNLCNLKNFIICMYVCMLYVCIMYVCIWRYLKNDIDGFAKLSQVPLSLFALSLRSRPSCASFHFFSEVFLVALPWPRYAQMTREKCFDFNTAPRFHVASSWSKWLAVAKRVLPEAWEFERDIPLHCTCHNSGGSVQQRERMINHEKQEHSSQWS